MKLQIGVQTKVTLEWSENLPGIPQDKPNNQPMSSSASESSEGFFDNFDVEVELMITKRRAQFLKELVARIEARRRRSHEMVRGKTESKTRTRTTTTIDGFRLGSPRVG